MTVTAALAGPAAAAPATMHPSLAARLAGMGEHGIVNLQVNVEGETDLLDVRPDHEGLTGASIHTGQNDAPSSCRSE